MPDNKNKVLVIAAHPDDELLGCGGTVALHTACGDVVRSVIVCEGESLRDLDQHTDGIPHYQLAANILGVESVVNLGFADQKLEQVLLTDIISQLENVVRSFQPNIVYCQFGGDINLDHQVLFRAIEVAVRPTETYIESVYAFDTASSTEWAYPRSFVPDTWVDISTTLATKLSAMDAYKTELRDYPHPRSLKALEHKALAWGNQCCMHAAEAFMTIRRCYRNDKTPG